MENYPKLFSKIALSALSVLLVLSIVLPTVLQPIKASILGVVFFAIFGLLISNKLKFSGALYFYSCLFSLVGMIWSIYGELAGNPGAIRVLTVMVVYPFILPLCSVLYKKDHEQSLYNILLISAWLIVILDLSYIMYSVFYPGNILQEFLRNLYADDAVVDNAESYFKFTLPNVSSIIFLLPFFISNLIFRNFKTNQKNILLLIVLMLMVALLSGRRGLLVSMLAGPMMAFILTIGNLKAKFQTRRSFKLWKFLCVAMIFLLAAYLIVDSIGIQYYADTINSIFDFTNNESNILRAEQFRALLRGFFDAPFFGKGAGAVADVIRSKETPWAYELFYVAAIFQYGLFAFIFYATGIIFIAFYFRNIIKMKSRSSFEFYFLSGFISFFIASATNPYIAKFDYMWVIFIPYAIINLKLIGKRFQVPGLAGGSMDRSRRLLSQGERISVHRQYKMSSNTVRKND
ncbi:MAG: O-antigen ligase family protein [Rhodoferax sp.]|nr:O-antigen ligase family protein [Rhodoferax sp.]